MTLSRPVSQAVILAGPGDLSAALADIHGKPFLAYVLREAARAGVKEVLLLGVDGAARDLAAFDGGMVGEARCRVLTAPAWPGSAGALRYVASALDDGFYVLRAGRFFDLDLNALAPLGPDCLGIVGVRKTGTGDAANRVVMATASEGSPSIVASVGVPSHAETPPPFLDQPAFNRNRLNAEKLTDYNKIEQLSASYWTCVALETGICALSREALAFAAEGQSLGRHILPALAAAGRLRAVEQRGYFIDITRPGSLEKARDDLPEALRRPAVFFDRDGVLNHDDGYTYRPEDLRLMEGAVETIRRCNRSNRYVVVVTNQSGVARGLYTVEAVRSFHAAMQDQLRRAGAHIDALYLCPHHPDGTVAAYRRACDCRKPSPGMIRQALAEWPLDVAASVMVGDRPSDMEAAASCGIRGVQFGGGNLERFCEQHGVI